MGGVPIFCAELEGFSIGNTPVIVSISQG
jgi:50S ribosomal subunit-associated GTPase HflX